jgi:hypothetical protein
MSDSNHDVSNLAEVKAVLGRLQRISRNPHASGADTAGDDAATPPSLVEDGSFSQPAGTTSLVARLKAAPMPVKAAILIGPVLAVAAGIAIFGLDRQPAPDNETPPAVPAQAGAPPQASASAQAGTTDDVPRKSAAAPLQLASELMESGQVRAARDVLLRVKEESADVAWALARSYDPNFLVTVRRGDAGPDVAEATRWYRAWYDIAVKQGLVADSVSLDRIIRSMSSN